MTLKELAEVLGLEIVEEAVRGLDRRIRGYIFGFRDIEVEGVLNDYLFLPDQSGVGGFLRGSYCLGRSKVIARKRFAKRISGKNINRYWNRTAYKVPITLTA